MKNIYYLLRFLLPCCLLLTCISCSKDTVLFVYSRVGDELVLPCINLLPPVCSLISWSFFTGSGLTYSLEVSKGQVEAHSDKYNRMSITSNCSLSLRDLKASDAGSYVCLKDGNAITTVYLSLLTITTLSTITNLQPGGNITLSCILFTYYDTGSCKSYSSMVNLRWVAGDGTILSKDNRYELIENTRCNVTLVMHLQVHDNNRKWRCQVETKENNIVVFLDFISAFVFEKPSTGQNLITSALPKCPVHLPISRILLCVFLPIVVIIVGLFKWRLDHKKRASTCAASIQFHEIN